MFVYNLLWRIWTAVEQTARKKKLSLFTIFVIVYIKPIVPITYFFLLLFTIKLVLMLLFKRHSKITKP